MKKVLNFFKKYPIAAILILFGSIPLMLYPRFDMQDISIIRPFVGVPKGEFTIDQRNYMHFVEYFRGEMPLDSVHAPFSFRPAVPYAASFFPFKTMTSINVLNIFIVILTVVLIWFILRKLDFEFEYRILGGLLYTVSFPTFYYSTTGYVDAAATMLIFAIVAIVLYEKFYYLIPLMIIASLTKETCVVVFPFIFLYIYKKDNPKSEDSFFKIIIKALKAPKDKSMRMNYFLAWVSFLAFIIATYLSRKIFGIFGSGSGYLWLPSTEHILDNVYRIKTYLSPIISLGFPGLFALLYIISKRKKEEFALYQPFLIGIIITLILWLYSYLSAYADGRYIWSAYPYLIPLGLKYFKS